MANNISENYIQASTNFIANKLDLGYVCIGGTISGCHTTLNLIPTSFKSRMKNLEKNAEPIAIGFNSCELPEFKFVPNEGIVKMKFTTSKPHILNFNSMDYKNVPSGKVPVLLGETDEGEPYWMDLAKNPHTLIAGTTGSGKSSLLHVIINNCLQRDNVDLYLIDPKSGREFNKYKSRVESVATGYNDAVKLIEDIHQTMELIYEMDLNPERHIVVIIDEISELMQMDKHSKRFETALLSIAQKARDAKIHLILATQRPDVKTLSGTIRANFPARIACKVNNMADSRIILDKVGAESLMGKGDSIIRDANGNYTRVQLAYI